MYRIDSNGVYVYSATTHDAIFAASLLLKHYDSRIIDLQPICIHFHLVLLNLCHALYVIICGFSEHYTPRN